MGEGQLKVKEDQFPLCSSECTLVGRCSNPGEFRRVVPWSGNDGGRDIKYARKTLTPWPGMQAKHNAGACGRSCSEKKNWEAMQKEQPDMDFCTAI
jgi:hypothetical protein